MSSEVGQRRKYWFARDHWRVRCRRRRARPASAQGRQEIYRPTRCQELRLEPIIDPENLLLVYDLCQREGGQAPGIDGLSYEDYSVTEAAAALRDVAKAIGEGRYRPARTRPVFIPKSGGRLRRLELSTIVDRVVAKAVAEAVTPILDPVLLPGVYGFRPGRSQWQLLLDMERRIYAESRWVIAQDDVRDAFPSVNQRELMNDLSRHIDNVELLRLMELVLQGADGALRTKGIDQGNALSPAAMNLRLHHALDRPFTTAGPGNPLWYRWADNIIYPCQSVQEGRAALQRARQILQPTEFALKGEDGLPVNLQRQGAAMKILGFRVSKRGNRLEYGLGRKAWTNLSQQLEHLQGL